MIYFYDIYNSSFRFFLGLLPNVNVNINLPRYNFVHTNSKSQAGGVGLYLANKLEFSRKTDIDISHNGIESCWVELACQITQEERFGSEYQDRK